MSGLSSFTMFRLQFDFCKCLIEHKYLEISIFLYTLQKRRGNHQTNHGKPDAVTQVSYQIFTQVFAHIHLKYVLNKYYETGDSWNR